MIQKNRETGNTTEVNTLQHQTADLIEIYGYKHLDYFAEMFLSHYLDTDFAPFHLEIFDALPIEETGQKLNILAPRGSAKSTCIAIFYPLHRICYKKYDEMLEHKTDNYILIISLTETIAKDRIKSIKTELEDNQTLRNTFGNLIGKKWTEKEIITENNTCIKAIGRGGQVRGSLFQNHRPTLIISDDLDNAETLNNPELRKKDQLWFDTDLAKAGSINGTTNFINIDTVKHKYAIANNLRNRPQWKTLFYQAIPHPIQLWHPNAEELWKQWEDIYTDMAKEVQQRNKEANEFYQKYKNKMHGPEIKELWPQQINYLDIRKEICNEGYFPVMRERQNEPHDNSQALFNMKNALRFSITNEGFLRSDNILVKWQEMSGATIFLDWAGGKELAKNDFAAVVGIVWVPLPGPNNNDSLIGNTNAYVLFDYLKKVPPTQQIKACINMIQKIRTTISKRDFSIRLGIEDFVQDTWKAQKQMFEQDYRKQRDKRNLRDAPRIQWIQRYKNKYDRIDALQPPIHNRWIAFHEKLTTEFMTQMADYPTGEHLDAPDALEGACQLRISKFEAERKQRKEMTRRKNQNFKISI